VTERTEGRLITLHEERAFTCVGHGRGANQPIPAGKIEEVVAVVAAQLAAARSLGAGEIHIIATAAVRSAPNGEDLADAVAASAGAPVWILAEEEEARLAFAGVAAMLQDGLPPTLAVVDVGGGSTEIAVGPPAGSVAWWASLPLGSADLTDRHIHSDPPRSRELAVVRHEVGEAISALRPPTPGRAVAVGGSATSLKRLVGSILDTGALQRALDLLSRRRAGDVAAAFDVDPRRARLLPAGLIVLHAVATLLDTTLTIGRGGIREGVLLEAGRR
jgi:exopolyphosphatase/guanosine-5'-triphosphate,3'-diphosphate pyrophosphatase